MFQFWWSVIPPTKLPGARARRLLAARPERRGEMRRLLVASLLPSSVIAASFSPPRSNAPQPRSLPRRLGNFFSSMLEDSRIDYSALKGRPRSLGFEAGGWAMKGEVPVKSEDGYEVATFAGGCFCELAPLTQRPRRLHARLPALQAAPHSCTQLVGSIPALRRLRTRAPQGAPSCTSSASRASSPPVSGTRRASGASPHTRRCALEGRDTPRRSSSSSSPPR